MIAKYKKSGNYCLGREGRVKLSAMDQRLFVDANAEREIAGKSTRPKTAQPPTNVGRGLSQEQACMESANKACHGRRGRGELEMALG